MIHLLFVLNILFFVTGTTLLHVYPNNNHSYLRTSIEEAAEQQQWRLLIFLNVTVKLIKILVEYFYKHLD